MSKAQDCILIIEDDTDQAFLISEVFKHIAPEVKLVTAEDHPSALAYLADVVDNYGCMPGLILLDLYLPRQQDGFDLLLKMQDFFNRQLRVAIPVVVLTHSRSVQDITASYALRANAYMIKPVTLQGWHELGTILYNYWFKTVTLPKWP